jgi:hypothetical protein
MEAYGLQGIACGGTLEAVVTHTGEAFGQDVHEPASYELVWVERHDGGFPSATGGPVEADVSLLVIADESLGANGAAPHIAGEIADRGSSAPDVLKLHVPGFTAVKSAFGCWRKVGENLWVLVLESLPHEVAEARSERCVVNKKRFFLGINELFLRGVPSQCGNDAMNVWVVLKLAAPSMEDAAKASGSALSFRGDHIAQRGGTLFEDEVVEFFGVSEAGLAKFTW